MNETTPRLKQTHNAKIERWILNQIEFTSTGGYNDAVDLPSGGDKKNRFRFFFLLKWRTEWLRKPYHLCCISWQIEFNIPFLDLPSVGVYLCWDVFVINLQAPYMRFKWLWSSYVVAFCRVYRRPYLACRPSVHSSNNSVSTPIEPTSKTHTPIDHKENDFRDSKLSTMDCFDTIHIGLSKQNRF